MLFATFLGLFRSSFYGVVGHFVLLGDQCHKGVCVCVSFGVSIGSIVFKKMVCVKLAST